MGGIDDVESIADPVRTGKYPSFSFAAPGCRRQFCESPLGVILSGTHSARFSPVATDSGVFVPVRVLLGRVDAGDLNSGHDSRVIGDLLDEFGSRRKLLRKDTDTEMNHAGGVALS